MKDPVLQALDHIAAQLENVETKRAGRRALEGRSPSRWVGQGADPDFVQLVARGEDYTLQDDPSTQPANSRRWAGGLALSMKALAEGTGSAGGFLVPVEVADEILKMIRARSAVARLGPRVVEVEKQLDITSISTGASASYVAENAQIPISEQTFAQAVLLRPKELAALVPASNRLLKDAAENPDVEQVIRDDLAEVMALRADLAFIQGTGTGNEPLGIRNATGLTPAPSLGANGATPTFDHLKDMVANLRTANAPFEKPGWIFHPRTINTLEKVKDSTGRYLAETDLLTFDAAGGGGTLLGFKFSTSVQIPTNITVGTSTDTSYIIFGSDWSEAWIGEQREFEIDLSGEASYWDGSQWVSAFQNRQTLFRAVWSHDFALRRPALFSVMTGVRP